MSEAIRKNDNGGFVISGLLVFETVAELAKQGNQKFKDAGETVELDLSGVSKSDSAGLALLVEWRRSAQRRKQVLTFSNIPKQILDIAEISGVRQLLLA